MTWWADGLQHVPVQMSSVSDLRSEQLRAIYLRSPPSAHYDECIRERGHSSVIKSNSQSSSCNALLQAHYHVRLHELETADLI